ncbi:gastrula zinc finger protein XlCGF57.1-like [Melanotaenia boesemani]|uniref:gastrula zinc finger protein XlCGF57.1-like n=1 Tax=Melanotaenia boesemani TaxID=1250792 RepID=UPI001C0415B0|nr:gastrula zinc finger protein XlCGF57.1-like [Melanotaenia boesemani]
MTEMDFLQQHNIKTLPLKDKLELKRLGINQPQDVVVNQSADVQKLLVIKEEVPWNSSLDQQDPKLIHIKEEDEEDETKQGEQLNGREETSYSRFPFNVIVKNENDEEEPQSSCLCQRQTDEIRETEPPSSSSFKWIKTETDGEDFKKLELASNPNILQPVTDRQISGSSETDITDTDDDDDEEEGEWQQPLSHGDGKPSRAPESGVNSDVGCKAVKKPFSCSECGKQFLYKQSLKRHMRRNTGKTSSCSLAQKCSGVTQNARVHTGKKKFGCLECGKTFRDQFSLKSHIRVHTGEQPFGCDVCGKRFKHQHDVKIHMRIHTGEMPFSCDVCGKRFKHQHNLKTHMRIHTGEKPYVCDICGKRARHQNNLKTHMIVHKGERPFGCDLCGKRFNRKTSLRAHKAVHTGEKPYSCDVCGKSYKRKTHLRTHMIVHTEEKPFGCEVCGKRFNRKTYLATHMAVHTGDKPHSCDFCGKKFTRKTHLDSHITVHTGEKPFGCGVCGQEFTQQGSLNRHMRFHLG